MENSKIIEVFEVNVDIHTKICACCSRRHMQKTLAIKHLSEPVFNLGVTCAGRWFDENLSGNPYYSAKRLELKLNALSLSKVFRIVNNIKLNTEENFDENFE